VTRCRPADNPFRSKAVATLRYRCQPEVMLERFAQLGQRAALVGPHGCGKSTLRQDLCAELAARGLAIDGVELQTNQEHPLRSTWRRLRAHSRAGGLVWIDGAEQIAPWRWRLLKRGLRGPLLITTHRPGRLPALHQHTRDDTLALSLCAQLIGEHSAREHREHILTRYRDVDGNCRELFRALYDDCASGAVGEAFSGTARQASPL
jgi:energy-coupling factor transporter ATP-binding protein EcfA2